MKILMVAPTPFFSNRGCHIRILCEVRALRNRGHEVAVVTYHLGETPDDVDVYRIPNIPWYTKREAGPSWHKPFLDILLTFRAWQVARKFKPDVLYGHLHEGTFIAHLVRTMIRRRIPLVFDVQDSLTAELRAHQFVREGSLLDRFFLKVERWVCAKADHLVCSSRASAEMIRANFVSDPSLVDTMEDGVDKEHFHFRNGNDLRRRLGIPEGKKLVVYSGALLKVKGIDYLFDAISITAREREDIHFLLVGYPVEDSRERIARDGLLDRVTFTGAVPYEELPNYLKLGDLAVDPKTDLASESSAKTVFYMAAGLPVVGFDTPATRNYLGETGVYARSGSAEDLAEKILILFDSPEKAAKLGREAKERVWKRFDWEENIRVVEKTLSRLTNVPLAGESDLASPS